MSEPAKYNINLCLHQDITTIKADVLVSSIHRSKDLGRGPLAQSILKSAGPAVQRSLNMQEHSELVFGQIVSTQPGNLARNSKCLLFVCMYEWRPGNDVMLEASVSSCLEIASENKHKSIAFPALGMGGLHYPACKSAVAILKAINNYFRHCKETSLEHVFICLKDNDSSSSRTFREVTIGYLQCLQTNLGSEGPEVNVKGLQQFEDVRDSREFRGQPMTTSNSREVRGQPKTSNDETQASGPGSMISSLMAKCKTGKDLAAHFTFQGNKNSFVYWTIGPTFNPQQQTLGVKAEVSLGIPKILKLFSRS